MTATTPHAHALADIDAPTSIDDPRAQLRKSPTTGTAIQSALGQPPPQPPPAPVEGATAKTTKPTTPVTATSKNKIGHSRDLTHQSSARVASVRLDWPMPRSYSGNRYIVKQYTGDRTIIRRVGMSRRQLLLGGGSALAAAAVGLGAVDVFDHSFSRRGPHRVGIVSSPSIHVPNSGALERNGSFQSRYMQGAVGWTVSQPPGPQALQGILFCLHGYHNNHRFAFDSVHVPDAAAYVGLRVAVAGVDGGADSYWHERHDRTDAMAMLLEEFVPMVRNMVGDLPQALMGWSMGGYGALLAAVRARSQFVALAPASPAIWLTPGATAPGAFDNPADFYANDIFNSLAKLSGLAIAVACGTGDPFYATTRDLVKRMDYPHSELFGPGFHDATYWASVAPNQLRAIAPALT